VSDLPYGKQVLWPDHCVQGTDGANLHPELDIPHAPLVIRKGFHQDVDSYSAFLEADRKTPTGPAGYLRERALTRVFCAGFATDFCVTWSALDARKSSFDAVVIEDACRAIDTQGPLGKKCSPPESSVCVRKGSSRFEPMLWSGTLPLT
jgi:nicotinamidase/pyrazinamidase